MNTIQEAFNQILKFNQIAGALTHNDHEATLDGIALQLDLCQEELHEAYDEFTDGNSEAFLMEACDMFVVASGLLQRLHAAGFNVEKALARVNAANISKYPTDYEHDNNDSLQPENTTVNRTPYGHVAYKNYVGKVKKPNGFVKATATGCIPENFFGSINGELIIGDNEWLAQQIVKDEQGE